MKKNMSKKEKPNGVKQNLVKQDSVKQNSVKQDSLKQDVPETTNTVPTEPVPVVKKIIYDPITDVMNKYKEAGWTVMRAPKSINDLVAQKDKRFHFIQIITPETIEDARFTGLAKNTFIQNAFSNGATPIFAHVQKVNKRTPTGMQVQSKITFEDVNLNSRVIISAKKEKNV